jgi:hypothetical protein
MGAWLACQGGKDRHRARGRIAGGLIRTVTVQPFQQRLQRTCGLKFSFFSVSEALMPLPSKQAPISTSA